MKRSTPCSVGPRAGRVVIYSGQTGDAPRTITSLEGNAGGSYGEWLGYDVTGIGDVNADGIPDILVSGALNNAAGASTGKVYVIAGRDESTSAVPGGSSSSVALSFGAAQPNPFYEGVRISFDSGREGPVSLEIYEATGRLVRSLGTIQRESGSHQVTWDGRSDDGAETPGGVYFARFRVGGVDASIRLVRLSR